MLVAGGGDAGEQVFGEVELVEANVGLRAVVLDDRFGVVVFGLRNGSGSRAAPAVASTGSWDRAGRAARCSAGSGAATADASTIPAVRPPLRAVLRAAPPRPPPSSSPSTPEEPS